MEKISPIKKRILQYIEYKGITKQFFCNATGISYQNIKGKSLESEFGGNQIAIILSTFDEISSDWLLLGNGEMLRNDNKNIGNISNSNIVGANNNGVIISGNKNNNNNIGIDNRHYYSDSPDVLRSQIDERDRLIVEKEKILDEKDERIREKDERIREKDERIRELLGEKEELKEEVKNLRSKYE